MSGNVARGQQTTVGSETGPADRIAEVDQTDLPARIEELSAEYDDVVGERDIFLWKWIHNLFDAFTLSCVEGEAWADVKESKTVLTMFVTVLDDLADNRGDGQTFEQARRVPFAPESVDPEAPGVDGDVVRFVETLWAEFESGIEDGPRHDEFEENLYFDLRSVIQAMDYARVQNATPEMTNLSGTRHYGPHNMVMFPYAAVDLMHSPSFERRELGTLRQLIWELQPMARIGNWITTWEREVYEADYSAGVVVEAIERGVVEPSVDPESVDTAAEQVRLIKETGIEREFKTEWQDRFRTVENESYDLESVDSDRLIEGMRTVMDHHKASYGRK